MAIMPRRVALLLLHLLCLFSLLALSSSPVTLGADSDRGTAQLACSASGICPSEPAEAANAANAAATSAGAAAKARKGIEEEGGPREVRVMRELFKWAASNGMRNLDGPNASVKITFTSALTAEWTGSSSDGSQKRRQAVRLEAGLVSARPLVEKEVLFNIPTRIQIRSDLLARWEWQQHLRSQQQQHAPASGQSNSAAEARPTAFSKDPLDVGLVVPVVPPLYKGSFDRPRSFDSWYPISVVAAFLLRERAAGEQSFWAHYIRSMPESVPLSPILFGDERLAEFEYDPMISLAQDYQTSIANEYDCIRPEAVAGASKQEFIDMMLVVLSRCFNLQPIPLPPSGFFGSEYEVNGVKQWFEMPDTVTVVMPVADMFNYDPNYSIGWSGAGDMEGWLFDSHPNGVELFVNYGAKNNDNYLLNYGFLPSPNFHDNILLAANNDYAIRRFAYTHDLPIPTPAGEGGDGRWEQWQHVMEAARGAVVAAKALAYGSDGWQRWFADKKRHSAEEVSMNVWPHGHLDAPMLVGYAALWHRLSFKQDASMDRLAHVLLPFAWILWEDENLPCTGGATGSSSLTTWEQIAVRAAVSTVKELLLQQNGTFSTSLETDREELLQLQKQCQGPADSASGRGVGDDVDCDSQDAERAASQRKAVLMFRMAKKQIIEDAMHRIDRLCGSFTGGLMGITQAAANGDSQPSLVQNS